MRKDYLSNLVLNINSNKKDTSIPPPAYILSVVPVATQPAPMRFEIKALRLRYDREKMASPLRWGSPFPFPRDGISVGPGAMFANFRK
ncbi:hypothetical protein CEXT_505181 [Caerostris extrusa]|uniref:Uncharacterized protein n=1 Tax=Caerostris extrusa TaxID=172846 RepID=A0AAV4N986_CAEEX|nr:hypothetical protein CEXT_505181 [Caerostris extrusa]